MKWIVINDKIIKKNVVKIIVLNVKMDFYLLEWNVLVKEKRIIIIMKIFILRKNDYLKLINNKGHYFICFNKELLLVLNILWIKLLREIIFFFGLL